MTKKQRIPEYFGKYLLLERIAAGGMAEIFRAVLRGVAGFEKTVALKRILPVFGDDDGFVTLFQDEARIVSTLTHANIAQVFEFGVVGESYFLTMELVEGADLSRLAKAVKNGETSLSLTTVSFIIAEAANGLAYAHKQCGPDGRPLGIVHRDVSPQNVLLSYSGGVKVTDFGIAKAKDKVHQTATGMMMGKLRYMSPEQVAGQAIDGRSDVFALGVVLYELITGGPVFPGEQTLRLAELIHTADIPPPSARNSAIPSELDRIAGKALARDVDQRYKSAAAFAKDLTLFRNQTDPGFTPDDLGDLITKLFPPRQQPNTAELPDEKLLPLMATEPTPVRRKAAGPARVVTTSAAPLTFAEAVDATQLVNGSPSINPALAAVSLQMELATRTRAGDESAAPIELVSRKALDASQRPPPGRRKKTVSREAWIAVGLGALILASAAMVLARFVLPGSDRTPVIVDAALSDANPDDVDAPPDAAQNALGIAAGANEALAEDILQRLENNRVIVRGTVQEDYVVFLNALDYQLASISVDAQGRASSARPLPPVLAERVNEHTLTQPVADVVEYLRLTGKLPEAVSAAARGFVRRHDHVVLSAGARRVPAYSVAALAAWFSPDQPDLAKLALANARLDRFCPPPPSGTLRALPFLCERDALVSALGAADQGGDAAALRDYQAVSDAATVEISQTTFTLEESDYTREGNGYALRLLVSVVGPAPADTQYLLQSGGMRAPLRTLPQELDGQLILRFSLPETMYAPVFHIWSSDKGSAFIRLPHPSPDQ